MSKKLQNFTTHPFKVYIILLVICSTVLVFGFTSETKAAAQSENVNNYMVLVEKADSCIKKEDWTNSEKYLLKALKTEPSNPGNLLLFSNLGIVRMHTGDLEGARQAFDIAISRAPNSTVILGNRATTNLNLGNLDDAIADLSKALALDSTLIRHKHLRATCYLLKKEPERAKKDFNDLLQNDSTDIEALSGMAKVELSQNNPAKALDLLEKALHQNHREDIYYQTILALIQLERYSEARKQSIDAINRFPDDAEFYVILAFTNKLLHLNEEAENSLELAKRMGADQELINKYFK